MTVSRSRSRRLPTSLAGAALGLLGTLAIAGPGSAYPGDDHDGYYDEPRTQVSGSVTCDDDAGEWVVTWSVTSLVAHWVEQHELVEIQASPSGSSLDSRPLNHKQSVYEAFTITQRVSGDATEATLAVRGKWHFQWYGSYQSVVESNLSSETVRFDGACRTPEPEAAPIQVQAHSTCNGLVVTVTNPEAGAPVTALIRPSVGREQQVPLQPGESQTVSFPDSEGLTVSVTAGDTRETVRWDPPKCVPPDPGEVEISARSSCEELTLSFANPRDGVDVVAIVTPSVGEPQRVRAPVDKTVAVTIPGAEGLTTDVAIGKERWVFAWVPGDCTDEVPIGFASDCQSLTIEITNPLVAGALEATVTSGDDTRTVTLEPLETADVVIPAGAGTVATVRAGQEVVEAGWEPPAECGGAGTDAREASGALPSTGSAIVGVIVVALTLIGVGFGLTLRSGRSPARLVRRTARHRRSEWRRSGPLAEILRLLHIPAHRERDA